MTQKNGPFARNQIFFISHRVLQIIKLNDLSIEVGFAHLKYREQHKERDEEIETMLRKFHAPRLTQKRENQAVNVKMGFGTSQ